MSKCTAKPALLLIGPTGSGKSPLGGHVAGALGWSHLDFGELLRLIANDTEDFDLTAKERAYVKHLLQTHALFPDEAFHIVRKIVEAFLDRHEEAEGVVLNGLPRHVEQAQRIEEMINVLWIVHLSCTPEAVAARVARRARGLSDDHAHRADDTPEAVACKLEIFDEATKPLLDHYHDRDVDIITISVGAQTKTAELAAITLKHLRGR